MQKLASFVLVLLLKSPGFVLGLVLKSPRNFLVVGPLRRQLATVIRRLATTHWFAVHHQAQSRFERNKMASEHVETIQLLEKFYYLVCFLWFLFWAS